jgi:hypothetical protein
MTEPIGSVDSLEVDMKTKHKATWVMTNFVLTCVCGGGGARGWRAVCKTGSLSRAVLQHVNYLRAPTQRFIAGSPPALFRRCLKST